MHKVLVTGGCGFIGSHFVKLLMDSNNYIVYNLDCLNYASKKYINEFFEGNPNYKFIYGNVCNKSLVLSVLHNDIDVVVHFAAQSHVDSSFTNSCDFITDNVMATNILLESCKEYGKLSLFLYISTDEVYGDSDVPRTEADKLRPTNPYSATKAAAEMLCSSYKHSFKLPIIITRSNNVYGALQYREKLIPKFIHLLKNSKKCTIHGTGECIRTFIHVSDLCNALFIVMTKGEIGEVYNIGSEAEYSVLEITKLLVRFIKKTELYRDYITFVSDRYYNDTRYSIDYSKIKSLGWSNTINFETGLLELCEYSEKSSLL